MDHTDATLALARRIRLLAAIQGAMGLILWIAGLLLQETAAERLAVTVGGVATIGISAALFWAARRPWATAATTANFVLIVSLVAALDPLGGTVSGASWSLYLIWPSLAALVLRRLGPSLVVSFYALALLILIPALEFGGVIPAEVIGDPDRLRLMQVIHVVVFLALTTMTFVLARAERAAFERSAAAGAELRLSAEALRQANESLIQSNDALQSASDRQTQLAEQVQRLETPVIRLSERVALLPLVGALDEQRIARMGGAVLGWIHRQRAATLIVDLTGVVLGDDAALRRFAELVRAARLLGCQVFVTGLSAEAVATLVSHDLNLLDFAQSGQLDQILPAVLAGREESLTRPARS